MVAAQVAAARVDHRQVVIPIFSSFLSLEDSTGWRNRHFLPEFGRKTFRSGSEVLNAGGLFYSSLYDFLLLFFTDLEFMAFLANSYVFASLLCVVLWSFVTVGPSIGALCISGNPLFDWLLIFAIVIITVYI